MTPPSQPSALLPEQGGGEYRQPEYNHLAQHYGRDRTSAQLAQDLGRTPGAIRTYACRHPEVRPPKQP